MCLTMHLLVDVLIEIDVLWEVFTAVSIFRIVQYCDGILKLMG
jgi:hypothetical protein